MKDGTPLKGLPRAQQTHEKHVVLRISGKPGEGYLWVLYPRGENEPLPELQRAGKTLLLASHDDRYFDAADLLVVLDEGKIREISKPGNA